MSGFADYKCKVGGYVRGRANTRKDQDKWNSKKKVGNKIRDRAGKGEDKKGNTKQKEIKDKKGSGR